MADNQDPSWGENKSQIPKFPKDTKVTGSKSNRCETAFGLGLAATICACIALLIGWIPFIGFIAYPISGLALILGVIGFIFPFATKKEGLTLPIIGLALTFVSIALPIVTTKALMENPEFSEAMDEIMENPEFIEAMDSTAKQLVMSQMEVINLKSERDDQGIVNFSFELRNNSDLGIKYARVNCDFLNKEGGVVYETEFTPISWHGTPEGSVKSLQPGEIWSTDQKNFFDIDLDALEDWDPGSVRVEIGSVEIND